MYLFQLALREFRSHLLVGQFKAKTLVLQTFGRLANGNYCHKISSFVRNSKLDVRNQHQLSEHPLSAELRRPVRSGPVEKYSEGYSKIAKGYTKLWRKILLKEKIKYENIFEEMMVFKRGITLQKKSVEIKLIIRMRSKWVKFRTKNQWQKSVKLIARYFFEVERMPLDTNPSDTSRFATMTRDSRWLIESEY